MRGIQRLLARTGVGSWTLRSGRGAAPGRLRATCQGGGGGGGVGNRTGEESGFGEKGSEGLGSEVTPVHSCPSSARKSVVEMLTSVWLQEAKGLHAFPVPSQSLAAG